MKIMPANEQDPTCKALIQKFESYVTNISRKPYIKMAYQATEEMMKLNNPRL